LDRVQRGLDPDDWKPMQTVGPGAREIRVRDVTGAFRVVYVAIVKEASTLLHAFAKKTQRAAQRDLTLAQARYRRIGNGGHAMKKRKFASVWDAIEPSATQAANMKARAEMMIAIRETVAGWGLTQAATAKRLGLTQPRMNDLLRGRISKFSLDALINVAAAAGLAVRVEVVRSAA
jgi:predicted XRE-type DNA-binding protein